MSDTLSTFKRRRLSPSPPPADPYALSDDDSASTYAPLKLRRAALLSKLAISSSGVGAAEKRKAEQQAEELREQENQEREAEGG